MAQSQHSSFSPSSEADWLQQLERLSELYHENSKLRRADRERLERERHDPVWRLHVAHAHRVLQQHCSRMQYGAKHYPHVPSFALPSAPTTLGHDLGAAIQQRRSQRCFTGAALSLVHLAALLYFSYGITHHAEPQHTASPRRAVPSGGALYPLELYLLALHVEGLAAGVYHYEAYNHALEQLRPGDVHEALEHALLHPELSHGAAAVLVISGILERASFKYHERAYRFLLQESGHVVAHLCLTATALGLGHCPVGGFVDDAVNDLLDLDGVHESVLYLCVIGRRQFPTPPSAVSCPELDSGAQH